MQALRIAFAGTPAFAADHLRALLDSEHRVVGVFTQPDRAAGRGKQPRPSPVKALALEHGLPVYQPLTLRDEAAQAELAALDPDVLVVVAYGLILPQAVLDLPQHGCINVHGSLLPRWRGAAPIQRAIEAGDVISGVTIMRMEAGLDTGPMLAKRECPITPLTRSADLYARLAELGPELLIEVLADLPALLVSAEVQDDALATYASKIEKSEAHLDWRQSATVLARRVRAFNPAPGCFSHLGELRVKLWEAQPRPGSVNDAPGTITQSGDSGITVACGEGALELTRLQLPGARAMAAAEVLRGRRELFQPGRQFDLPGAP
ncbi:MAG: methionyl-tRNA formyltransferase [Halieaceae bacterium]|nr:methionyl-tRNA formyltransferase [Halieaceae bacterium]